MHSIGIQLQVAMGLVGMRAFETLQLQPGEPVAELCNQAYTIAGKLRTSNIPQ